MLSEVAGFSPTNVRAGFAELLPDAHAGCDAALRMVLAQIQSVLMHHFHVCHIYRGHQLAGLAKKERLAHLP